LARLQLHKLDRRLPRSRLRTAIPAGGELGAISYASSTAMNSLERRLTR
jgi:hypothetical protein